MHNYWIGIMALAFVIAMATWLLLVFNAGRPGPREPQESAPHREVIGGEFEAREGGRQLMPHPAQPSEPPHVPAQAGASSDADAERPRQKMPAAAEQTSAEVPAQRPAEMPEHTSVWGDRP
jgi:hypothetical protein